MRTNILRAALFTPLSGDRWGLPMLCWGEPGVAKTAVIEELAYSFENFPCETLSPSERGEGAFGVVPVPSNGSEYSHMTALCNALVAALAKGVDAEKALAEAIRETPKADTVLEYPRPEWTDKFVRAGRGVVFVDEVTSTPPALQAPCMGLVLARRVGGFTLPPGVRVVAAANPTELAAGGFDLAAPLANRFGHLEWHAPTADEHCSYMMRGSTGKGSLDFEQANPEAEEKRVLAAWPEAWARAVGIETAFIQRRSGLKNSCPKAGDPKASRSWPSDRTWEMATRALASSEVHGLSEPDTEVFVASFVGEGPAGEFFAFKQEQDLPDPAAILDGKETFKHNPARLDRTVAVLNACVSLVTPQAAPRRGPRSSALWGLLETLATGKADLDLVVPAVHALIEANLHAMKDAAKTLGLVQPVLKAAGIKPQGRR